MNDLTTGQAARSEAACRHLAVCIIHQAFRDLSGSAGSRADQASARTFLSGSPMLYRWCEVAHLNAAEMMSRATTLMDRSVRPSEKGNLCHRPNASPSPRGSRRPVTSARNTPVHRPATRSGVR